MLSKRDKFSAAFARFPCLRCPVCRGALHQEQDSLVCPAGHTLNVSRKGCVNVLSSKADTFYDAALFASRRRVFAAGCYDAVIEAIERLLPPGEHRLLDAGCGDGWYLASLLSRHASWRGAGIDISRDAIFQATDHVPEALWVVGDLRFLPFQDGAFTALLDVLTPANYGEFARVLAPGGVLIKVYPGALYLRELRQARGMAPYAEGEVDAYLREKTVMLREERVTVTHAVSPELFRDFVWMTPLNQDLTPEGKDALAEKSAGLITIDLHVSLCRMKEEVTP